MQQEADGRHPIVEDWLFKPWLTVKPRRDPIPSRGHRAGDPRIAGFVRADETDGAQLPNRQTRIASAEAAMHATEFGARVELQGFDQSTSSLSLSLHLKAGASISWLRVSKL